MAMHLQLGRRTINLCGMLLGPGFFTCTYHYELASIFFFSTKYLIYLTHLNYSIAIMTKRYTVHSLRLDRYINIRVPPDAVSDSNLLQYRMLLLFV